MSEGAVQGPLGFVDVFEDEEIDVQGFGDYEEEDYDDVYEDEDATEIKRIWKSNLLHTQD